MANDSPKKPPPVSVRFSAGELAIIDAALDRIEKDRSEFIRTVVLERAQELVLEGASR